ncbi:MAG: hypothetical protein OEQ12_02965 [Nitrosopumilus sp.]|nr:hypothetical protein [Nitrosopumilus sp.]
MIVCPECETIYLKNHVDDCTECGTNLDDYQKIVLDDIEEKINLDRKANQKYSSIPIEDSLKLIVQSGLTTNQSKVYLCLNQMGIKTASEISKILGLPRTEIYHLLKILIEKEGVLKIHDRPMKYGAVTIEKLLEKQILSEKKGIKKLEETLLVLKNRHVKNNSSSTA